MVYPNLQILEKTLITLLYNNLEFKLLIIILLKAIIYNYIYKKQEYKDITKYLYKYKVNNFVVNKLYIILYIGFYIYVFFYIRTQYLQKDINLYTYYIKIKEICKGSTTLNTLLISIVFILCLYLLLFIWIKINGFFVKEIIKQYLILTANTINPEQSFNRWRKIQKYSVDSFYISLMAKTFTLLLKIKKLYPQIENVKLFKIFTKHISKFLQFICYSSPTYFILIFFLYELLFNNYTLSPIFNQSLFIYMFYALYNRYYSFVNQTSSFINEMLFNMYYRSWTIKYIGIPKEYEAIVYSYVYEGLSLKIDNFDRVHFSQVISEKCTWFTKDGKIYKNSIGEIEIVEHNDKDIFINLN